MILQDRYEERDGFIIKKGETAPVIFAAMDAIKAGMLREASERKRIRECRQPESESDFPSWGPAMGQWGVWNISDRD